MTAKQYERKINAPVEPKAVAIPPFWTVNDVLQRIPESWRDARIAIQFEEGWGAVITQPACVRRVTLVEDITGTRVVILGYTSIKI